MTPFENLLVYGGDLHQRLSTFTKAVIPLLQLMGGVIAITTMFYYIVNSKFQV